MTLANIQAIEKHMPAPMMLRQTLIELATRYISTSYIFIFSGLECLLDLYRNLSGEV